MDKSISEIERGSKPFGSFFGGRRREESRVLLSGQDLVEDGGGFGGGGHGSFEDRSGKKGGREKMAVHEQIGRKSSSRKQRKTRRSRNKVELDATSSFLPFLLQPTTRSPHPFLLHIANGSGRRRRRYGRVRTRGRDRTSAATSSTKRGRCRGGGFGRRRGGRSDGSH